MNIKNKKVTVIDLEYSPYKEVLAIQEKLFNQIIAVKRANRVRDKQELTNNYLLWAEHAPVFTLGKSGKIEHLLLNEQGLKEKGIEYYSSSRGGDITFHGPGQIVGYPIFDLDNFFTDIHKYLRFLEQAVINVLLEYDLQPTRSRGETGVWLDVETPFARKICALGVRASRWVTMHGFALNVTTDLSYFDHIIPCGIRGKGVTSLAKELGKDISMNDVKEKLKYHLGLLFEARFDSTTL
ncbi:MAG: lipoyl(octanoyl) transferase [Flavobacteriaceae bacterium]|jgi:lipoyl(octanoyl) transferase|tara:strand:- start:5591 stop:6307 length:717 start_codon:yes stop_codon:yes gene_type:complete